MKIKILTDTHEHQDQKVQPGTVLDVDEPTGKHLIDIGAAEPAKTKE
jgi:hypothetical protein